jgi:hypothetical protein
MKQVVVEMADADMRTLKRVARQLSRGPAELIEEQLKSIVASKRVGSIETLKFFKRSRRLKARTSDSLHLLNGLPVMIVSKAADLAAEPANSEQEAARQRRLQILRSTSGLMKSDPDFPKDGLHYQSNVRAEWE